jgi:hypothetical protein
MLRIIIRKHGQATKKQWGITRPISGGHKKRWEGRRVELNAMGSQQFIDFLERKFQQHGVKKVVPDQKSLENAYIRAFRINAMQKEFMEIADRINKIEI